MATRKPLSAQKIDEVLKAMLVLSRTVEHTLETRAVAEAVKAPLSSSKVQILRLLDRRGVQTSTQVARFLGVSKPAVSQIVDSMVSSRLVIRRTATEDRREVHLRLTKKGRDQNQMVLREQRHCIRNAAKNAPSSGTDRWVKVLQEISIALVQGDEAFAQFCAQCGAHADGSCVLSGGDADCAYLQQCARVTRNRKPAKKTRKS